ncbi:heterokaryon incompatibility protein [Apiospora marii]|uniref:Heterokaryon incompatibility protein n=1 Tax=Apiospora marii TaxID=335849 RepID=A0ABR1T174_9PEZI
MGSTIVPELLCQQQEPIADSGLTIEELRSWHEDYMEDKRIKLSSSVITVVETDKLNYHQIERRIEGLATSVEVADGFCTKCQDRFDHWPDTGLGPTDPCELIGPVYLSRTLNTLELQASSKSGCRFCAFLFSLFTTTPNPLLDLIRKIEGRLQALGKNYNTHLVKNAECKAKGVPMEEYLGLSFPDRATGHIFNELEGTKFLSSTMQPSDFGEIKPVATVQKWLRECSFTHSLCRSNRKHRAPTRLISIGNGNIRLMLTDEMEQVPAYAALSYCWGLEPFIMLTSETIDAFMIAIPDCQLPKTFRDAIFIARGLGISYIWIDALCIIQGDLRDWHLEAGRMYSVYGGSEVTIAASSAANAHQGCFERPINDISGRIGQALMGFPREASLVKDTVLQRPWPLLGMQINFRVGDQPKWYAGSGRFINFNPRRHAMELDRGG